MLTITGHRAGQPYDVTVDDGTVTGSAAVSALLDDNVGSHFSQTVTSGSIMLDLADERSVLAALANLTTVTGVVGLTEDETDEDPVPADAVH